MEEIGITISKYQPLRIIWYSLCDYTRQTVLSCPIRSLFKNYVVPSLFKESISRSSSKSIQPFFLYSLIKSFLSSLNFYAAVVFFFFLSFIFITHFIRRLARACVNPRSFFKLYFCTFSCLSSNSLISSLMDFSLHQHFSYVCSTCLTIFS